MAYEDLVNLDRYPIDRPGPELNACIKNIRAALAENGCAVLKKFITRAAIDALTIEADGVAEHAHRSFNRTNAYFTSTNPEFPKF